MKKLFAGMLGLAIMLSLTSTTLAETDTTLPSDVENVKAAACNEQVVLTWDAATDDVKVTGYKVYSGVTSVSKGGDTYTFEPVNVGDALKAEVAGLENGTKYFFAVTAYDAAGNESPNYSVEVNATPSADAVCETKDEEPPRVSEAVSISKIEVDVEFSETVKLPEDKSEQAFTIEDQDTFEPLDIVGAKVLTLEDAEKGLIETEKVGKVVRLTTVEQKKDANYILTATIDVADEAGNPIVSGTSDTAKFMGTDTEPKTDMVGPQVVGVEFVDATHLLVTFNEPVVLGLAPADNFKVSFVGGTDLLKVSEVSLGKDSKTGLENAAVMLAVSEMASGTEYTVTVVGVLDEAGNAVDGLKNSSVVAAAGTSDTTELPLDTTPPADATNFTAKQINKDNVLSVILSWLLPKDTDLDAQKLYVSTDNGSTYVDLQTLGKDLTQYEVKDGLQAENEYWFKLTEKDTAGNESTGVIAKVKLAETGPELLGLLLVSAGLGRLITRKK